MKTFFPPAGAVFACWLCFHRIRPPPSRGPLTGFAAAASSSSSFSFSYRGGQSLEARGLTTQVGAGRANDLGVRDTSSWLSGVQLHRLCHRFSALLHCHRVQVRPIWYLEAAEQEDKRLSWATATRSSQTQITNHQSKRQEGSELTEFPQITYNLIQ